MNRINVKGVGLLDETQIINLVNNARRYRAENQVLRKEIDALKEASV